MMQNMPNKGPVNFSQTYNQNNIKLGGNRMIKGTTSVTLPDCPCKDTCKGGACSCAECSTTNKSNKVWTQNIIPMAHHIKSTTRDNGDHNRGEITIASPSMFHGMYKPIGANRLLYKGARNWVYGVH